MAAAYGWALALLAGMAVTAAAVVPAAPKGAIIGKTGFATIRTAPPSPTGDVQPRAPTYRTVSEFYAQENGLTLDEAKRRLGEQGRWSPAFERLRARLQREEPGNFVGAMIRHKPDWAYVLFFKRDPERTLARYMRHPRFVAQGALHSEDDRRRLIEPWGKRWQRAAIPFMYALDAVHPTMNVQLGITEQEYRSLAARYGWGDVPAPMRLSFARELAAPRVDPRVVRFLRGFASESRATTMQMEMGASGRVILDNGCLRLASAGTGKGPLVVFHQETGIGLDAQGYLSAIDRRTGKAVGRVGETWSWAAPNPGKDFDGLDALKAACGDGPVENVGNPESEARFKARYPRAR